MKNFLVSIILRLLFKSQPTITFSEQELNTYNQLYDEAINSDGVIRYAISYPKQRFIQYIAQSKNVVLHGSNNPSIDQFEPRRQTLYNGKYVEAVFATKDGIWPLFYAVFDKSKLLGNIRNACLVLNGTKKYYYFSITRESSQINPWTNGMIYFLPMDSFSKTSNEFVSFDEWISKVPVKPAARLEVDNVDFYFHSNVSTHKRNESIYKTWLLYKLRSKLASRY